MISSSSNLEGVRDFPPSFIATAMIFASLPHSRIGESVFKRKSSAHTMTIMNDPEIGLPYGKLPRVMVAFLCTEAKRKGTPRVFLGKSQAEFAFKLGLTGNGGLRGATTRLREQSKRLFTSHITLTGSRGNHFGWRNLNISDQGMLLWDPHDPNARSDWSSWLDLSQPFFEECINHAVPIDIQVIHRLRSPLAIDIYIWMTYRLNAVRRETVIPWKELKRQFGANYADNSDGMTNFIFNFKKQLREVTKWWPSLRFGLTSTDLILMPAAPHVPKTLKPRASRQNNSQSSAHRIVDNPVNHSSYPRRNTNPTKTFAT